MRYRYFIILIIFVSFAVYFNSLWGGFISDDIPSIVNNPDIFTETVPYRMPPAINQTLYLLFPNNVFPQHLASVLLHTINCILLFYILNMFFTPTESLFGCLLFVVHPIHTEAVSWISGRGYLVQGLFFLSTLYLYYKYVISHKKLCWYLFTLGIFILFSLQFYPWSFFMGCFFMVLTFCYNKKVRIWYWLPFIIIPVFIAFTNNPQIVSRVALLTSPPKEITNMVGFTNNPFLLFIYSISEYAYLCLLPVKLTFYHEPAITTLAMMYLRGVMVFLLLVSLPYIYKKSRELFWAISLFIIILGVTYSPKPFAWLIAERYAYLPSIAFSVGFSYLYRKCALKSNFLLMVMVMILFVFSLRTVIRNEDYKTPRSFWEETTITAFQSPRSHNCLGEAFYLEGNIRGAEREFTICTELAPKWSIGWYNLAVMEQIIKNPQAIEHYEKTLSLNDKQFQANFNLGVLYLNSDQFDKAINRLSKALSLFPERKDVAEALRIAVEKNGR